MRIHVVDAFTDRPFAGNPAAVCVQSDTARGDRVSLAGPADTVLDATLRT